MDIQLNDSDQLYRLLRELRLENKLTQKELALFAGVHLKTISNIESGDTDIQLSTLLKILENLNSHLNLKTNSE